MKLVVGACYHGKQNVLHICVQQLMSVPEKCDDYQLSISSYIFLKSLNSLDILVAIIKGWDFINGVK